MPETLEVPTGPVVQWNTKTECIHFKSICSGYINICSRLNCNLLKSMISNCKIRAFEGGNNTHYMYVAVGYRGVERASTNKIRLKWKKKD